MKKLVLACVCALALAGCSSSGGSENAEDKAKEALTSIYSLPYAELKDVDDAEKQAEVITDKFKDVFVEATAEEKAGELAGFSAAADGLKVEVEEVTLEETAENQWSYNVTLKADDGSEATSFGAIALEDGKVSMLKVYETPAF